MKEKKETKTVIDFVRKDGGGIKKIYAYTNTAPPVCLGVLMPVKAIHILEQKGSERIFSIAEEIGVIEGAIAMSIKAELEQILHNPNTDLNDFIYYVFPGTTFGIKEHRRYKVGNMNDAFVLLRQDFLEVLKK